MSLARMTRVLLGRRIAVVLAVAAVIAGVLPGMAAPASGAASAPLPLAAATSKTSTSAMSAAQASAISSSAKASVGDDGPAQPDDSPASSGYVAAAIVGSPRAMYLPSFLNLPQATHPIPADRPSMTFDSARNKAVLFGVSGPL
jgi:hypothetical protein